MNSKTITSLISFLFLALFFSTEASANEVKKYARAARPIQTACIPGMKCHYLYEKVNILMKDREAIRYCRERYGEDAYLYRMWITLGFVRFCALNYDKSTMVLQLELLNALQA